MKATGHCCHHTRHSARSNPQHQIAGRVLTISYAPYTNAGRKHTISDLRNRDVPYSTAQDGTEYAYGKGKGEGKVHPRTGREVPEGE